MHDHERNSVSGGRARGAVRVLLALVTAALPMLASAETISPEQLRADAEELLRRVYGPHGEVEIDLDPIGPLGEFEGRDLDVRAKLVSRPERRGPVPVVLELYDHGRPVARLTTSATVRVWREVAVAAERLDRHAPVTDDAIEWERRDVRELGGRYLRREDDLTGLRVRRIVPAGAILSRDVLRPIPVIERGDKVLASITVGGVTVTATAVALEAGGRGEEISIRNESSGKRLHAVVVAEGRVAVGAPGAI